MFTNEAGLGSAAIAVQVPRPLIRKTGSDIHERNLLGHCYYVCTTDGNCHKSRYPVSRRLFLRRAYYSAFEPIPFGRIILGISLIAFAIATLIGWSYFGEKAVEYLFGKSGINTYRICYIIMIYVGSVMSLRLVWELTDFVNALMAIPNLICLLYLRHRITPYK